MIIEMTFVFDTDDGDDGPMDPEQVRQDLDKYAESLNLDASMSMPGYQGWRVVESQEAAAHAEP